MFFVKLVFTIISFIIIFIGFLLNGFIVIANLFWWKKCQTFQSVDVLLTGLGVVRLVLLSIHMQYICYLADGWPLLEAYGYKDYNTFAACTIFCSLWWGSLLCVFYCVKITNYSYRLFTRLKMNISEMIPWLLFISLVISFISSLPYYWVFVSTHPVNRTHDEKGSMEQSVVNLLIIFFSGSIIPFTICCLAIYLIIESLVRHSRNMNSRDSNFSDSQRDIHLSVIWSMVSFLLFYALYCIAYIIITLLINTENSLYRLFYVFIFAYPSLHSISFILSNRKLKNSFFFVLRCTWLEKVNHQTP